MVLGQGRLLPNLSSLPQHVQNKFQENRQFVEFLISPLSY